MPHSKRALATAAFFLLIIGASIAIYYFDSDWKDQQVVVRSIRGHLDAGGAPVALGFSYPAAPNGLILFRQGESFYVFLDLSGNGTIQSVNVATQGFDGSVVAPLLPLSINNYTEPSVVVFEITAMRCCFNGTIDFTVNATI